MTEDKLEPAAEAEAANRIDALRASSYDEAANMPTAAAEDIVVAGKEVQLTVFRQNGIPEHPDAVLITVQISRAGLGGIVNFFLEKGLVFLPDGETRDATEDELAATRS